MNQQLRAYRDRPLTDVSSRRPRTRAFVALVALFAAALTISLIVLFATSATPSISMLGCFVLLMILAEHRDRLFGDETSMSGSIVVAIASVVAFRSQAPLLGPLLCGVSAGLYWPHLRDRSWAKVIVNAASIGFSTLAAAGAFGIGHSDLAASAAGIALLAPLAVVAYWLVNSTLLASASVLLRGGELRPTLLVLIRSETVMLVFALVGAWCGLVFIEVGTWEGVLALGGVLVAVDVLVISRPRPSTVRARHAGLPAAAARGVALLAAFGISFEVARGLNNVVAIPFGAIAGELIIFVATLGLLRRGLHCWDPVVAMGVAVADAPMVVLAALTGAVMVWAGVVGAAVAASVGLALVGVRGWWRRRERVEPVRDEAAEERAHAIVEMALLDGLDRSR